MPSAYLPPKHCTVFPPPQKERPNTQQGSIRMSISHERCPVNGTIHTHVLVIDYIAYMLALLQASAHYVRRVVRYAHNLLLSSCFEACVSKPTSDSECAVAFIMPPLPPKRTKVGGTGNMNVLNRSTSPCVTAPVATPPLEDKGKPPQTPQVCAATLTHCA